jgi:hypothetical protein
MRRGIGRRIRELMVREGSSIDGRAAHVGST